MSALLDLAFQSATQAATRAGGSLFGMAKRAAEGRAFISSFAQAVRSQSQRTAATAIGELERGNLRPQMPEQRRLLELYDHAQASYLTDDEAVRMLNEVDTLLHRITMQVGWKAADQANLISVQRIARELAQRIKDNQQAVQLGTLGVADPALLIRQQYPVGEPGFFSSKHEEVHQEEGLIPILTPGSSNVYSFWWIPDQNTSTGKKSENGTLYVTYKTWYKGTKQNRPNEAGSTYAYSNVARSRYKEFVEATSPNSAGWAVWEYLRVRGTRSGHQHPYRLASGQVNMPDSKISGKRYRDAGDVHGGVYVPRKATAAGFRARTLVTAKGMVRSQLSPQGSFSQTLQRSSYTEQTRSHSQWRQIMRH